MFFFCTSASLKEMGIDVGMANSVMAEEEIVHPKKIRDFPNPLFKGTVQRDLFGWKWYHLIDPS